MESLALVKWIIGNSVQYIINQCEHFPLFQILPSELVVIVMLTFGWSALPLNIVDYCEDGGIMLLVGLELFYGQGGECVLASWVLMWSTNKAALC